MVGRALSRNAHLAEEEALDRHLKTGRAADKTRAWLIGIARLRLLSPNFPSRLSFCRDVPSFGESRAFCSARDLVFLLARPTHTKDGPLNDGQSPASYRRTLLFAAQRELNSRLIP